MRLENTGHGVVDEAGLKFPSGLRVIGQDGIQSIVEDGTTTWELGSIGPGEKREWHIGFAGHKDFPKLGERIEYLLSYRRAGCRRVTTSKGTLSLTSYSRSLVRAYASEEDILTQLERLAASVEHMSRQQD